MAWSPSALALFPEARVDWKAWEGSAPTKAKCNFHGKQHQHPRQAKGQLEMKDYVCLMRDELSDSSL